MGLTLEPDSVCFGLLHTGLTLEPDSVCSGLLRANSKANSWQRMTGDIKETGSGSFQELTPFWRQDEAVRDPITGQRQELTPLLG